VDYDGASAAESISDFLLDEDAVRRFLTATSDCNFGPSQTWSFAGIKQIGAATSTIISSTDYIANYLAGNSYSQILFYWMAPVSPTLSPTDTPIPTQTPTFSLANTLCGYIENYTDTGALAPRMTIWDSGQVVDLGMLDSPLFNMLTSLGIPGNFRIYDPVFFPNYPEFLSGFSNIEKVSNCP